MHHEILLMQFWRIYKFVNLSSSIFINSDCECLLFKDSPITREVHQVPGIIDKVMIDKLCHALHLNHDQEKRWERNAWRGPEYFSKILFSLLTWLLGDLSQLILISQSIDEGRLAYVRPSYQGKFRIPIWRAIFDWSAAFDKHCTLDSAVDWGREVKL